MTKNEIKLIKEIKENVERFKRIGMDNFINRYIKDQYLIQGSIEFKNEILKLEQENR